MTCYFQQLGKENYGGGTLPGVFDLESDSWRFFFLNLAERDTQIHGSASERLFAFISGTVTEAGARSKGGTRGWRPVLRKSMTLGAGGWCEIPSWPQESHPCG